MESLSSSGWSVCRLLWGILLVCCIGCSAGEPYQPISGSVKVDGQPLADGTITLYPNGPGTTCGGKVIDGRFELPQELGPTPGNYRVEIVAYRATGKTEFDVDTNTQKPIEVQYLPLRYNVNSQLTIDVEEGKPAEFEFDLKTK